MKNANTVLQDEHEPDRIDETEAFYIENRGQMETAQDSEFPELTLDFLAESFVSPVQSFETSNGVYYGVIEYTESDEWYGFEAHDSRSSGRRVIGVREIPDATRADEIPHVTAGDPSGSFSDTPDASYTELAEKLIDHYDSVHGEDRSTPDNGGPPDHVDGPR